MSEKQFEHFLAEKLIAWGAECVFAGYRYQFQSPDAENSKKLFAALESLKAGAVEINYVEIPFVQTGTHKLLIVLHSEESGWGFSENFISHIRDVVAAQQSEIKACALLVIHNSMLDTLINSAENVAQSGWVWHPREIKVALESLIDPMADNKRVSECLLSHRFDQIIEDGATMFGFEELFKAIVDDGDLRFDEIGLLDDPVLKHWEGPVGQIKTRLEENKILYEKLDYITHNFPTSLEEKLGELDFSPSFVNKHFSEGEPDLWKGSLEFSDCKKEQEKNRDNLLELEKVSVSQGDLLVRTKADTKAGKRDQHLIYLLDEDQSKFDIELCFLGGRIEKKQCSFSDTNVDTLFFKPPDNAGGKRSRVVLSGVYDNKAVYFTFRVKREKTTETYHFRGLVVRRNEFYEKAFQFSYLIEPKKQRVTIQTEDNTLQIAEQGPEVELAHIEQVFDSGSVGSVNFERLAAESDYVEFIVIGKSTRLRFNVEGAVATDVLNLPLLLDQDRFLKLYSDDYCAIFNKAKNKVQIDNQEVAPKGKRLTLLQWEKTLLNEKYLYLSSRLENSLTIEDIDTDYPDLSRAFRDFFHYLSDRGTLPCLSGWGEEYCTLVTRVVSAYNQALGEIAYDKLLTKGQRKLVNIGFACFKDEEYLTPFHPMILAYHLYLVRAIQLDKTNSFKSIPKVTLSRLNAQGLLPFVYDPLNDFSYTQVEPENSMWLKLIPQKNTSYEYIRKLVKDKVSEFHDAFGCLFASGPRSKIIVNSINNGFNREVFLGLVDFIKKHKDKVCQIHVNVYDDTIAYCEFDRFADAHSYDQIKVSYGLDKGAEKEIADTIVDLLRTRLTYSKFRNAKFEDGSYKAQEYAHITFFKNNNKVQATDVNVTEEVSGVVAGGLLAGEAATCKEESYFTAFGLKGIDCEGKLHLQIAERLNGLIKPARKANEQYSRSKSMALAVSDKFKQLLKCSYKSSIWTTIIDPKVTLDFFDSEKNVVLIHYSDNYTNSVNYDAITVTEESELYKKVLEQDQGGVIEEFNAFNGEWLLKMITANDNERKEKRGIIGAYKFVNCLLQKADITWVPLSVAEIIRVSGNIGLKMSESDFSRRVQGYKSGSISDDVLFVGFKSNSIVLLPLEVKTGKKQTHSKGVSQAKELKHYLIEDILGNDSVAGLLYRGLFIRQVLMQIDKYKLYHLYDKDYFDTILSRREWWLQGAYTIQDIADYPAGFLVSHVENDTFFESTFELKDDILKIQLPISYLPKFIKTPLRELFSDIQPAKLCHINPIYVLSGETQLVPSQYGAGCASAEAGKKPGEPNIVEDEEAYDGEEETVRSQVPRALDDTLKVLIGHSTRDEAEVFWEPTNTAKFMNTNSGIIGTMGTGKTQCTKSVVTQLYRSQHHNVDSKPIGILIFDYKSDYVDDKFIHATSGKKYNLHKLPYNPLSLFGSTPMLPVHTARGFSETMGKAFGLGQKQQLKLRQLISQAYELAGIKKADPDTWHRPAPTISDLWALFIESEPAEDSLYAALESLHELEVFEDNIDKCTSLYELVSGITVIELAGYPAEIQSLVVALTLDLFYSQMQKQGKPEIRGDFRQVTKLILVDEADNFMSQNFPSLRKILKEGREYGVGVILSTQDITHFKTSENDYSAYILSWIVHRVSQIKNQDIKSIFNKDDRADQDFLMQSIRGLEKHHSLYVDGDKKITKIRDLSFWELMHDDC